MMLAQERTPSDLATRLPSFHRAGAAAGDERDGCVAVEEGMVHLCAHGRGCLEGAA